ncbi:LysR substrate-binding domain-containing protein [Acidiphilium sp.]|uniref:LysR substrate-binding domain-containing protein n=2 Tax=Acidiphilium sp. TaxID=527 RepID=UPI00258AA9B3|nr:LysR substrate-binding domain-containing protein [Acidiphilium sp.]
MEPISMANGNWRAALPALAVFEAAARHLNFSRAARELGATQPAVSHQVGWLEAHLGCRLFHRRHRGVSLTPEGQILFEAAAATRAAVERARDDIRALSGQRPLTVATDYGFAGDWLIPRLGAFAAAAPATELRIVASQFLADPLADPADVAILMGTGAWPGRAAHLLFRETVSAVASPALLRVPAGPADLARMRLLHLEPRHPAPWLTWRGWFAAHGIDRPPRPGDATFDTYSLVQQAAIAGQGIALGWHPLIAGALETGRLACAAAPPVTTGLGYYLLENPARRPPGLAVFRDWLLAACRDSEAAGLSPPPPSRCS